MPASTKDNPLTMATIVIVFTVILLSMMEILDMTVINVALPVMMGNLHVSINNITWLITAYIFASGFIMPATGSVVNLFGCRKILLISIAGFAAASALCGITSNFWLIVVFRAIQGLCGASLVPLSQYIIINNVNKKFYSTAIAIWGAGVTIAPILGPTLGGIIIQKLNWRFLFFINIPVSIIAFILIYILLQKTKPTKNSASLDYTGFILLAITTGCGLFVLNRGDYLGWLTSKSVVYLLCISGISCIIFIIRGLTIKNCNIIDFSLFQDRKFLLSTLLISIISAIMMGMSSIMPIFFETFLHYSTEIVGLINIPAGTTTVLAMGVAAVLIKYIDARWLILLGLLLSAYATWLLSKLNLSIDRSYIIYLYCLRGFGFGFCFIPIISVSFMTLDKKLTSLGTGIFNFSRNIGSSIGVTLASSNLNNLVQTHWHQLASNINVYSLNYQLWLSEQNVIPNIGYTNPAAIAINASEVLKHSYMLAFNKLLFMFTLAFSLCLPLILLLKKSRANKLTLVG